MKFKSEIGMKLGMVGLRGVGKTSYIVLLSGLITDSTRIRALDPKGDPDFERVINRFEIVDVRVRGAYSIMEIMELIEGYWMKGKEIPGTLPTGELKRYHMKVRVPVYRKEDLYETVSFDMPDPAGESLESLYKILNEMDTSDKLFDDRQLREEVLNRINTILQSEPSNYVYLQLRDLIKPTDYDGFLIFIEPNQNLKDQALLYALLKVLFSAQKKKFTISIIFSKSIAYGRIRLSKENLERLTLDIFQEHLFKDAFTYLRNSYTLIYQLIRRLVCEGRRAKFAGAFFYDAFIDAKGNVPEPKWDKRLGVLFIRTLSPFLPLIHAVHVHMGRPSPLPYRDIRNMLCM